MFVLALIGLGCRLGMPPITNGYFVEHVEIRGHEFGLNRMLETSIQRELSYKEAIGNTPLQIACLGVQENLLSTNQQGQLWELKVEIQVTKPNGQMMSVKEKERFLFRFPQSIAFAQARHNAYQKVSDRIALSIVNWVLFAPKEKD